MTHPERLGKYPITGVLGKGAMGVVYMGFDPVINRPVAIKTIHKALIGQDLSGSSTTARFKNEARAVGRMSHPNIVAIYEYGEDEETAYIAMEYVEGRPLSQILAGSPRPPEADILTLMDQLLAALACAHAHGVWHRDVKPANLIVTHDGQLKVTDFGIARIESVVLTQITSTIGTPGYMAPEQYIGEGMDHRVDVFAAGALLYNMLVGHPPFRGTPETVMYKVVNDHPLPPSQVPEAGRPPFYDAIVAKALAKKPEQRYATVTEFREALAQRSAHVPDDAGETTVIIVRGDAAHSAGSHAPAHDAPSGAPASGGTPIPGWDAATLHRFEVALASFVGPMARVLVRQAAKVHADTLGLTGALSEHLSSDEDRLKFQLKLNAPATGSHPTGSKTAPPAHATHAASAGSGAGSGSGGAALPAELVAAALNVLAHHMGPIASVVVKKASAKAHSAEQFYLLLAEQAAEGPEREQLLKALRKHT